jgi:circadian clock protein KaiC
MASEDGKIDERISTGMSGLDDILGGGFDPDRLYLVEGTPGAGKTTLALQFLLEDLKRGENVLYITLSESESELRLVATRHYLGHKIIMHTVRYTELSSERFKDFWED